MSKYLLCGMMAAAMALSSAVYAEGEAAPKKEKAAKAAGEAKKTSQFTGDITAVDEAAGTLSVKHSVKDETKSFKCAADCKVATAEKKDATIADLKVGDKVLVIFAEEGGAAVAKKIGPAKAAAAKKDPAEKKEKKEKAAE